MLMLLATVIWGFAFVAQRIGAQFIGPFTFNGIRFGLGAVSLIPLILYLRIRNGKATGESNKQDKITFRQLWQGMLTGTVLFAGAALQQIGLGSTTVGKAAFITGFYIVLVPIFGIFLKSKTSKAVWISAVLSIAGLFLISVTDESSVSIGDVYELIGAFFWSAHILLIHRLTQKMDPLRLSLIQFISCSVLSLFCGLLFEDYSKIDFVQALIPILYGGCASVGIAYTLQVFGQKYAKPSHAAIILSLESVFAVIGGFLLLGETMSLRGYIGCILMLSGVLLSQLERFFTGRSTVTGPECQTDASAEKVS